MRLASDMEIPRLHPDTIEQVRQRADIVDVISQHVVLRKRGKDFQGLCPFHEEKSPSFTVSPGKQMYYCFGCQAGGNVIKFLMELGKRSFGEVVLDLARRYQVAVQTLEPEQRQELQRQLSLREQLYEILAVSARFFEHALRQPQGQSAYTYLQSQRQLREETIQQFQLGYSPAGWETLYRYLVEQKHYPVQLVEKAGLIAPRKTGGGYYDRFRERLMIPIQDIRGRVIGFGGRSLGDEQPKYLNSPETELFDKGKTLFALDKAKEAIAKQDQAVVVEGYFDAIALHSAEISNVIASLGTALSLDQVRQLLRYTESKQIVLNFDADSAGTKAAERAIGEIASLAYKGEVQLRILNLPDGKDADEFLRKGDAAQYQQLLKNSPLWLDWQIQQTLAGKDLTQADQFEQAASQIVKLLSNIDNDSTRTHYIHSCAQQLSRGDTRLGSQLVENLLTQLKRQRRPSSQKNGRSQSLVPLPVPAEKNLLDQAEVLLLRVYLHCPEYRQAVRDALELRDLAFSLAPHRFLWQQILTVENNSAEDTRAALGRREGGQETRGKNLILLLQDQCIAYPDQMAQVSGLFHLDENTERELLHTPLVIQAATASMERVICEKSYRIFLDKWQQTNPTQESECRDYQQKIYEIKLQIEELDRQRQFILSQLRNLF